MKKPLAAVLADALRLDDEARAALAAELRSPGSRSGNASKRTSSVGEMRVAPGALACPTRLGT